MCKAIKTLCGSVIVVVVGGGLLFYLPPVVCGGYALVFVLVCISLRPF